MPQGSKIVDQSNDSYHTPNTSNLEVALVYHLTQCATKFLRYLEHTIKYVQTQLL